MREIHGGNIRKWDHDVNGEPLRLVPNGDNPIILRGIFKGLRQIPSAFGEDKKGYVMDIDVAANKSETWSVPAILFSKLQNFKVGTPVQIQYEGKAKNRGNDNISHQFRVFELDEKEAVDLDIPF